MPRPSKNKKREATKVDPKPAKTGKSVPPAIAAAATELRSYVESVGATLSEMFDKIISTVDRLEGAGDAPPQKESTSARRAGKRKPQPQIPTEEELNDMSAEELADLVTEFDLDIDLDAIKGIKKKRLAVAEALEFAGDEDESDENEEEYDDSADTSDDEDDEDGDDDEDGEDDDEEEEEVPDFSAMSEKELKKAIKTHGLDVDLGDYSSLSKKRRAVAAAYAEAAGDEDGDDDEDDEDSW